jgi:hypothetical protein
LSRSRSYDTKAAQSGQNQFSHGDFILSMRTKTQLIDAKNGVLV